MNPEHLEEYLKQYQEHKDRRGKTPTIDDIAREDVLFEMIEMYRVATGKRDRKSTAKFLVKRKSTFEQYGFWKYIDEEELKLRIQ